MISVSRFIPPLRRQYNQAVKYERKLAENNVVANVGEYQLKRVKAIWKECVDDIPYYRQLVQSGQAPERIRSWQDFKDIPILTRDKIQQAPKLFERDSAAPDRYVSTSGSTGSPLRIGAWNSAGQDRLRVAKLALWVRTGYKLGDRIFMIWGHSHLLGEGWARYVNSLKRSIKDRILGYRRVSAYRLDKERCERIAEQLIRYRPFGIIGYASALDHFIRSTPQYHDQFSKLGVQFVMPAAEMPPRKDTIPMIEDVFDCPTIQEFGGVEFGHVAMKMSSDPWEVFPDLNVLEVAEAREEGGAPTLVTTLYDRYLPLFRYKQGDIVTKYKTTEHGHVTRFASLKGRTNDNITLRDGTTLSNITVWDIMKSEKGISNFQLVIEPNGRTLRLIGHKEEGRKERIREKLSRLHSELAQTDIEYVEDLETNRAGKRRWVIDKT